mmetsp:Transcript_87913/g.138782  ORF Transcript_87913/g.138782 Transcript_87913/m.138782 type:complete len:115 (+) Transcript_87913:35-379(+)
MYLVRRLSTKIAMLDPTATLNGFTAQNAQEIINNIRKKTLKNENKYSFARGQKGIKFEELIPTTSKDKRIQAAFAASKLELQTELWCGIVNSGLDASAVISPLAPRCEPMRNLL